MSIDHKLSLKPIFWMLDFYSVSWDYWKKILILITWNFNQESIDHKLNFIAIFVMLDFYLVSIDYWKKYKNSQIFTF